MNYRHKTYPSFPSFVGAKAISLFCSFFLLTIVLWTQSVHAEPFCSVSPDPTAYQPMTVRCEGLDLGESRTTSLNYRMNATIASGTQVWHIPGYFAADGDAGNTGAPSGNIWQAHFNPPAGGEYVYAISFRTGDNITVQEEMRGTALEQHGEGGTFTVAPPDPNGTGFNRTGKLAIVGKQYPRFANGDYFVKGGIGSPETFLGMDGDFDGTPPGFDQLDNFFAHRIDWKEGDPTWRDGAGGGIVGAVNYVADTVGLNSIHIVMLSEGGDGNNVFPWPNRIMNDSDDSDNLEEVFPWTDRIVDNSDESDESDESADLDESESLDESDNLDKLYMYDASKLDQWRILFEHAYDKGVHLHLLLSEAENDQFFEYYELDATGSIHFADARKLYYRELVARFGHLNITWDLGEEFGRDTSGQHGYPRQLGRGATLTQAGLYADYIDLLDAYNTPVVIHTTANATGEYTPLFGRTSIDGIAIQSDPSLVREQTRFFRNAGRDNGQRWLVSSDEQGSADDANPCYQTSDDLFDERSDVLWGNLMELGWGVEWYGGDETCGNDLTHGDLRTRAVQYKETGHAISFFNDNVADRLGDFVKLYNSLEGEADENGRVIGIIGNVYVIYLPDGRPSGTLSVPNGEYIQTWFNPRTGVYSTPSNISGEEIVLGFPPYRNEDGDEDESQMDNDWVVLVEAVVPIIVTPSPDVDPTPTPTPAPVVATLPTPAPTTPIIEQIIDNIDVLYLPFTIFVVFISAILMIIFTRKK